MNNELPKTKAIIDYLNYQFPATVGHLPLKQKIGDIEKERNELVKLIEYLYNMPIYDQDDAHRIRNVAKVELNSIKEKYKDKLEGMASIKADKIPDDGVRFSWCKGF